jgi:hypothetical protein
MVPGKLQFGWGEAQLVDEQISPATKNVSAEPLIKRSTILFKWN